MHVAEEIWVVDGSPGRSPTKMTARRQCHWVRGQPHRIVANSDRTPRLTISIQKLAKVKRKNLLYTVHCVMRTYTCIDVVEHAPSPTRKAVRAKIYGRNRGETKNLNGRLDVSPGPQRAR